MTRLFFLMTTLLFCPQILLAQISDDFSDGDLINNPAWSGDVDTFIVNAGQELQINGSTSSTATLYLGANTTGQTTWECLVRFDFSPSTSNFARVYLHSDSPNLEEDLNGYFVKIGGISGSDDAVELFRQDGSDDVLMIGGTAGAVGGDVVVVRLRVVRDDMGTWELFTDYSGGQNFTSEGIAQDNTHEIGNYFGFVCKYTSTRADKIFFDDVLISPTFEDETPPDLLATEAITSTSIIATFNEILDPATVVPSNFSLSNNITILDAYPVVGNASKVQIELFDPLQNLETYTLSAFDVADIAGNVLEMDEEDFFFLQAEEIASGDIVINELLFNPTTGCSDFLEIYNKSNKVLAINNLRVANRAKETGDTMRTIENDRLMMPGEYFVLTENRDYILDQFQVDNPDNVIEVNIPSFDDDEGNVTLFTDNFIMDVFDYNDSLHYALLSDEDGVSLERLDVNAPTNSSGNWHSAAASIGYGTPTAENSQVLPLGEAPEQFFAIENARVSPDDDGFEDVLIMQYAFDQSGFTTNIRVFDVEGRLIKTIANNELLATNGTLKWDGTTDEATRARIGIYVIWFEIFNTNGEVHYQKEPVVVAGKL